MCIIQIQKYKYHTNLHLPEMSCIWENMLSNLKVSFPLEKTKVLFKCDIPDVCPSCLCWKQSETKVLQSKWTVALVSTMHNTV